MNEIRQKGCQCGDTYYYPVPALEWDDRLEAAALSHSVDMYKKNYFSHTAPDGSKQLVALQPLRTEGQGMPQYPDRKEYSLTQINIPMGIGVKYFLSENVNLSFEIIHRKTFTDYIDDVSTSYIDPALFYANMPGNQAALAERMANKTNGAFDAGDKRGTPTNNDAYYSAGFKLGIRLGSNNRYGNSTNCPIRF